MPMPYAYRHASAEWRRFLDIARDEMGLESDNATYTAIEGVLLAFRRRLTTGQALRFADLLPAVPRAILVAGWHPAPPLPWPDRATLTAEAQALRPHHNLTPPDCILATAIALRALIQPDPLDACLAAIGPGAVSFWAVPPNRLRPLTFA